MKENKKQSSNNTNRKGIEVKTNLCYEMIVWTPKTLKTELKW
jgi:hypothetical protein